MDPAEAAAIANIKLNQAHRQKVWKWKCGVCGKKGNRNFKLKCNQSATYHAQNYRGHNVIIYHTSPDGDIFDSVIQYAALPDYSGDPPF